MRLAGAGDEQPRGLAGVLAASGQRLSFNMLEIGARPVDGEPFNTLLDTFASSRLAAVEIDPALCDKLNAEARPGVRYYPCTLGRTEETRVLHETVNPACTLLYEPDERYADLFGLLDVMRSRATREVRTTSLDTFVREHDLGPLDFIKIDIQGAELDVLQGGAGALGDVLLAVCEVEFVPLYREQPLYGDVDAYLRGHGYMLHKFLGVDGRVMKPLASHGTSIYPEQMMWSDALYMRDIFALPMLRAEQLLKLAVLLDIYDCNDVALYVLRTYDAARRTSLADRYLELLTASRVWTLKQGATS